MKMREFLLLTPRQFEAMRRRREAERKEATALLELMMAQQAALTFNTRMTYSKEPRSITEFMPSVWMKAKDKKRRGARKRSTKTILAEIHSTLSRFAVQKP